MADDNFYCAGEINLPEGVNLYYEDGRIKFPQSSESSKEILNLRKNCEVDEEYQKSYFLPSNKYECSFNPLESGLSKTIVNFLIPDKKRDICLEKYHLNFYEKGNFFKVHRDTSRGPDIFGTLVLCLPSDFTGGNLVLEPYPRGKVVIDWSKLSRERCIQWIAFFGDIPHYMEKILSGNLITITYKLYYDYKRNVPVPTFYPAKSSIFENLREDIEWWISSDTKIKQLGWGCKYMLSPMKDNGDGRYLKGIDMYLFSYLKEMGYIPQLRKVIIYNHLQYYHNDENGLPFCEECSSIDDEVEVVSEKDYKTTGESFFCNMKCAMKFASKAKSEADYEGSYNDGNDFIDLYNVDDWEEVITGGSYYYEEDFLQKQFEKLPLILWMNNLIKGESKLGATAIIYGGRSEPHTDDFYMYQTIYIDLDTIQRTKNIKSSRR